MKSPIGRWMGFSEPQYVGHCAFRGLAYNPDGHPFEPKVNYAYGRGLRDGYVPVSPTKVYWFIWFNNSSPGPKITDPLMDWWLWPTLSPSASSVGVVLVGDAWHPMTPNVGQSACCALEDAVVLARKLANALQATDTSEEDALKSYGSERWGRVFRPTIRENLVGSLLQWGNPFVCAVCNKVVIPKLVRLGPLLEHTNFNCEPLQ